MLNFICLGSGSSGNCYYLWTEKGGIMIDAGIGIRTIKKTFREYGLAFEKIHEEIEIIGFTNCGGCPGKKAVLRAKMLVERGADTIAFASCIQKGTPIGYPCPFHARMKTLLKTWLPQNIHLLDYTHDTPNKKNNTTIAK